MSKSRSFVADSGLVLVIVVGYTFVRSGPAWSQPLADGDRTGAGPTGGSAVHGLEAMRCLSFRSVYEMEDDQACEVI